MLVPCVPDVKTRFRPGRLPPVLQGQGPISARLSGHYSDTAQVTGDTTQIPVGAYSLAEEGYCT